MDFWTSFRHEIRWCFGVAKGCGQGLKAAVWRQQQQQQKKFPSNRGLVCNRGLDLMWHFGNYFQTLGIIISKAVRSALQPLNPNPIIAPLPATKRCEYCIVNTERFAWQWLQLHLLANTKQFIAASHRETQQLCWFNFLLPS